MRPKPPFLPPGKKDCHQKAFPLHSADMNRLYYGDNLAVLRDKSSFPDACVDLRLRTFRKAIDPSIISWMRRQRMQETR